MNVDLTALLASAGSSAPWLALVYVLSERWRSTVERIIVAAKSSRIVIEPMEEHTPHAA